MWVVYIKMDLRKIGWDGIDWIDLTWAMAAMNFQVQ
jgi:hypothetical protein